MFKMGNIFPELLGTSDCIEDANAEYWVDVLTPLLLTQPPDTGPGRLAQEIPVYHQSDTGEFSLQKVNSP